MSDLGALAYADLRSFRNHLRTIWRRPGRLLPWTVFAIGIPLLVYARFRLFHHTAGAASTTRLDAIVLTPLVTFAVLVLTNTRVGLFAGRAEARFVSLSPLPRALTIAYLQLRTISFDAIRLAISTVFLLLVFLPPSVRGPQFLRDICLGPVVLIAFASILLPRRLARQPISSLYVVGALITIAAGGVMLARDLLVQGGLALLAPVPSLERFGILVTRVPAWHPGVLLVDPRTSSIGLTALVLVAAAAVALLARTARDAFPELYELSQAQIDLRARLRKRALFSPDYGSVPVQASLSAAPSGKRVPAGLGVFLWKAWLEFSRTSRVRTRVIAIAFLLALGVVAAIIERAAPAALPSAVSAASITFIAIGVGSAQRLAAELRRPLFHLASPTLFERLAAMTLAQAGISWIRGAFVVFGAIIGGIDLRVAGAALVVMLCAFSLLVAGGFALFSLWPNAIDRRGPLAFVRVLALTFIVLFAAAVGTVTAIVFTQPYAGVAAGCTVALAGTIALLALATWRISNGIDLLTLDPATT